MMAAQELTHGRAGFQLSAAAIIDRELINSGALMNYSRHSFFSHIVALLTLTSAAMPAYPRSTEEAANQEILATYVNRPDDSFAWREVTSGRVGSAEYVEYVMTSQTWRDIAWKHQLFILRPANATNATQALLFVHGGRWKTEYEADQRSSALPREAKLFARLAESIRAPVGVLRQVPFQPLFDRKEDALIAFTFDQYLQTGENDWPLLLPMVKSAVRAMDVMQSETKQRWGSQVSAFTLVGASKRGWTSWLTAAMDERVMAVAPMVIDVLNMRAQMAHQQATWGVVSEEIRDYSALDLPARLATDRGGELLSIVDPYSYRDRLTQPKFMLLSTNDRYWPLDALKLYWNDLSEPKQVLYVPNQGHGLRDIDRVVGALSAVHRYAARREPMPRMTSTFAPLNKKMLIQVKTDRRPRRVLVWSARSATRDFREARWSSQTCPRANDGFNCLAVRAAKGFTAAFAEASFKDNGQTPFSISTPVCIAEALPAALSAC
jgi:PhoPQ-activated pathogenicity-related protein